ncbi:hypothetical protein C8F04DRAFT_1001548 [Mycena alexandri]|uniref:Clp1-like protein n=1 Tax=Mycena alexandri TaxID=1745969 RepID=A0AAD6X0T7_9AGAR|nr:hypothetical protein C8F04DRAFT_1001548 [Mycena alexandri]
MQRQSASKRAGPSHLQLPRTLVRPPFTEVSRAALLAASPELGNVSIEFIRKNLLATAPQMLAGISALSPSHLPGALPKSSLPPYITVPLSSPRDRAHPSYPTHALAISNPSPSGPGDTHLIFPVHALVLAAHCSKLPSLPPAAPRTPGSTLVHLPVLPLPLPSAPAFAILHAFLYSHNLAAVLTALFPIPPSFLRALTHKTVRAALHPESGSADRHALAAHLCQASTANVQVLMTHTAHVKELWQDMVALGINDPALWDTVSLAYEIVLGALNLAVMSK